jgi:arginyl-tRNA synthetase
LGWYDPKKTRVEHVAFGLVLGEDKKKFKTRSGDTVRLLDLLDEGVRRANAKLREKERDKELSEDELTTAAQAVAYGCIRYADLSQTRTNDYVFSFDRMLDDRGNTAVYLLYMYVRIRSIARNAGITRESIVDYVKNLSDGILPLDNEREFKLAKQILKFSDCVLNVLENLQLHKLCDYLYALCTTFSEFYKNCYVIDNKADATKTTIHFHRLVLCECTADVMDVCFSILGITPVPRM